MFLAAFAIQTFQREFIVFDYFNNPQVFAKNCENKAKPQMNCKGKCQMLKKLKLEEKKDQQNPQRKAVSKNEIILSSKSFYPTLNFSVSELIVDFLLMASGKEIKMPRSLLRPPIC